MIHWEDGFHAGLAEKLHADTEMYILIKVQKSVPTAEYIPDREKFT